MDISVLPAAPGVYLMRGSGGELLYVGKALNLRHRVSQYFRKKTADSRRKIPGMMALVRTVEYIPAESEREALLMERELISTMQPFFNELWKDSKTYPLLKHNLLYKDIMQPCLLQKVHPYFSNMTDLSHLNSLDEKWVVVYGDFLEN